MRARPPARSSRSAAWFFACTLALLPKALLAQSEPTPFWIAAPPNRESPPKPARVPAKKPAPPKPAPTKKAPAKQSPVKRAHADDDAEEAPAPVKKHRYEPLPPLPHIEPEAVPARPQPQHRSPVQAAPAPARPAPPTYAPPAYPAPTFPAPTYVPPTYAAPANPAPAYPPAPAPVPPIYRAPANAYPPVRGQAVVPIDEERSASRTTLDGSTDEAPPFRRFSAELVGGLWAKAASDGQSRSGQVAYGIDLGVGIFRWLQVDLRGVRSSGTDGDAYVNATTSHTLIDGHLLGVVNFGSLAVFGGVGGGLVFEKTQLYLQDVDSDPSTLSSTGMEPVGELAAGVRWRPWRGLTTRLEVDGMLRQGNVEVLFLLAAGWSF